MSFFDEAFRNSKRRVRSLVYRLLIQEREPLGVDETHQYISSRILSGEPLMVARFGNTELRVMKQFYKKERFKPVYDLLSLANPSRPHWINRKDARAFQVIAGFFPLDTASADRFCRLQTAGGRQLLVSCLPVLDGSRVTWTIGIGCRRWKSGIWLNPDTRSRK